MAFTINFTMCQSNQCADLSLTDTSTGYVFPGGGAVPTIDGNDVTDATITITDSSDIEYLFDWSDLQATFLAASSIDDLVFDLTDMVSVEDFTSLGDGLYNVVYTVTTSAGTETKEKDLYFICELENCVTKQIATVPTLINCDRCDVKAIDRINGMYALLQSLKHANSVGNTTSAASIYSLLTKLCSYTNCNCN